MESEKIKIYNCKMCGPGRFRFKKLPIVTLKKVGYKRYNSNNL